MRPSLDAVSPARGAVSFCGSICVVFWQRFSGRALSPAIQWLGSDSDVQGSYGGVGGEERPPPGPPKDKGKAKAKHKPMKRKIDPA